jgi:hypothetical protein
MLAQMLHPPAHIGLLRAQQRRPRPAPEIALQKLRKLLQVAQVGLAAQRPQPALHAQMRHILAQHPPLLTAFALLLFIVSTKAITSDSFAPPPPRQPPYPPSHVSHRHVHCENIAPIAFAVAFLCETPLPPRTPRQSLCLSPTDKLNLYV